MTLTQLKKKSAALRKAIEKCLDQDSEWTSPRGNGTSAFEAIEAAIAFDELIQKTKEG